MEIAGKVFIVTGGASGLGEGTARMLAANAGMNTRCTGPLHHAAGPDWSVLAIDDGAAGSLCPRGAAIYYHQHLPDPPQHLRVPHTVEGAEGRHARPCRASCRQSVASVTAATASRCPHTLHALLPCRSVTSRWSAFPSV